ncbi:MAG: hypothetical protein EXR77_14015 [Myxococcales bacterium]|nr:hypothetical protein [Myxococcales bacterium]
MGVRCLVIVGLLVASPVVALSIPRLAGAEAPVPPCVVADVTTAAIRQAFALAVRPTSPLPAAPAPSAWWVLVPTHINLGMHDGVRAGLGYTDSQSGGAGRWTQFDDQWLRLSLSWDLRPLVPSAGSKVAPDWGQRLEPLIKVESLATRAADAVRTLRKAQTVAASAVAGEALCRQAQGEAEAAALILDALIAAVR